MRIRSIKTPFEEKFEIMLNRSYSTQNYLADPSCPSCITSVINESLLMSHMPNSLKKAAVTPLLKKPTLNKEDLKNYQPVSHLPYIGKLIEKAATEQMDNHMSTTDIPSLITRFPCENLINLINLRYGFLQGSCISPFGFKLYTKPLMEITKKHINIHLYADDTQLYMAFKPEEK